MFVLLMKELKAAKHFIFMEFFIIDRGYMWDEILKVLEEKVKEGVEVRVMYDGMCCLMLLPFHYPRQLERKGIRCKMFSPIIPVLSTHQNYRDHRKIAVIDGRCAFTGGVNLADEYINCKVRFGHWKDTALMVRGDAVKGFTMMFLQMWDVTEKKEEDYRKYLSAPAGEAAAGRMEKGYVIPYGDSPFDKEQIGEQVYLDILSQAKEYVHIMTPYLILDDGMKDALCYAAKRGVEVIIIMPHIPDKKYAYLLARTYYPELLKAGVRIFEYEPGFVHAKVFASDDEKATVGTINLDFRSLYLHFECGTFLYRNPVIEKIEDTKKEKKWKALYLENQYIRIMVLPELGGRIQRAYDKTNGYDFVYYNHVIKPALVGLTGPWISGGIEFNWPQHHRPTTYLPVDYTITEHKDGSKTVMINDVDQMYGTKGIASFTLYPDKAYIEIRGQLYNRTPMAQTFLWWANPAVAVNEHTQPVFPPDVHAVMEHGRRDVYKFPIATGT